MGAVIRLLLATAIATLACLPALGADTDADGVPDDIELVLGLEPATKDNDLFAATAFGSSLFAMQQYRDFLAREGDAGGIAFWADRLAASAATRGQVIESFFSSPEFQGTIAPVARLYFAYFLRIPEYEGINFWIGYYRGGHSLEEISSFFAGSPEFVSRYGALSNSQFVTLVYNNVLGRAPDAPGLAFWAGQLDSRSLTRGQVMLGFSESFEYRQTSDSEIYVTMMYIGMLRRAPDAGGFAFWVQYRDDGNSGLALIDGFLGSPEYRLRFGPGDAPLVGVRADIGAFIQQAHGSHPGRLRIALEYARALEAMATGLSTPAVVDALNRLQHCASYLYAQGVWTSADTDLVEVLARSGFSKRRTLDLIAAFGAAAVTESPLPSTAAGCLFDPSTGLGWPASAQAAKETQAVCKPFTRVYFANGVWNDAKSAVDGLDALMGLGIADPPRSTLAYLNMFNPGRGKLSDVVEVFEQKQRENPGLPWAEFWRWTRGLAGVAPGQPLREFLAGLESRLASELHAIRLAPAQYLAEIDAIAELYVHNVKGALDAGQNVLIVAHSQGNLFANEVFDRLKVRGFSKRKSVKLVGVATPANLMPDPTGQYTTLGANLFATGVFNGADRVIQSLSLVTPVLAPNATLTTQEIDLGQYDYMFHMLERTYLRNPSTHGRIRSQIVQALSELEVEGGCTSTTLLTPPSQVVVNAPVTFEVRVQPNTTGDAPAYPRGSFEVRDGPTTLCAGILDGVGAGSCSHTFASEGIRQVRGHFTGGDPSAPAWQPSSSDPATVAVGSGVPSGNADVFASADTALCNFSGPIDSATCLYAVHPESTTAFSLSATRGSAQGSAQFGGGGSGFVSATASPGAQGTAPRGDGIVRVSNRFAVLSDTLPAGTPVQLSFQLPIGGSVNAQSSDNGQCTGAATGQALFFVSVIYLTPPAGRTAGIDLAVGVRSQRFSCASTRFTTQYQSTIGFGFSNGIPFVANAPTVIEQDTNGLTGAQSFGAVTVNVQVPIGEQFQFFVQAHANASMRGPASSSASVSIAPLVVGTPPAGVVVQRIP